MDSPPGLRSSYQFNDEYVYNSILIFIALLEQIQMQCP